ncbi:Pentatricopeptide repeat-containing protein 1, mitochondrial [Batrachochytrium dendrobatidis]|nr:Pentatricopeptide repeat-containing protein 1, mitochondrial [Batrachochytrium dendrobatidis]
MSHCYGVMNKHVTFLLPKYSRLFSRPALQLSSNHHNWIPALCTLHYRFLSTLTSDSLKSTLPPDSSILAYPNPNDSILLSCNENEPFQTLSTQPTQSTTNNENLHNIEKLMEAIDQNQLGQAHFTYLQIKKTNPSLLKKLPKVYFQKIIASVWYNKGQTYKLAPRPYRASMALDVFKTMKDSGARPDPATLWIILNIYAVTKNISGVESILAQFKSVRHHGLRVQLLINTCSAYIICGQEAKGHQAFEELLAIDNSPRSYNALIGSYAYTNNEEGMLATLERLADAKVGMTDEVLFSICTFYQRNKQFETVIKYVEQYRSTGGIMSNSLDVALLRAYTQTEKYQKALDYFQELRTQNRFNRRVLLGEEIRIHIGLENSDLLWTCLSNFLKSANPNYLIQQDLAKCVGSLTDCKNLNHVHKMSKQYNISKRKLWLILANGYCYHGDPASVKIALKLLNMTKFKPMPVVYVLVIEAYCIAQDIDGAISYAKNFEKLHSHTHIAIWKKLYAYALQCKHQRVEEIAAHMRSKYSVNIADMELKNGHNFLQPLDNAAVVAI